jgi:hypothetical protein
MFDLAAFRDYYSDMRLLGRRRREALRDAWKLARTTNGTVSE